MRKLSEVIAPCMDMLVILDNKVVDKKKIIGKRGGGGRGEAQEGSFFKRG
jgi:hypothetical protein